MCVHTACLTSESAPGPPSTIQGVKSLFYRVECICAGILQMGNRGPNPLIERPRDQMVLGAV